MQLKRTKQGERQCVSLRFNRAPYVLCGKHRRRVHTMLLWRVLTLVFFSLIGSYQIWSCFPQSVSPLKNGKNWIGFVG